MCELNPEMGEFTKILQLIPSLSIVVANKNLFKNVCDILKTNKSLLLGYDTTYSMGDFYVSQVVARHTAFENDPIFPIAALIHQKRDQTSHNLLFRWMRENYPELNSEGVVFVTDRELGITKSLKEIMVKANNVYCWNHVLTDIIAWLDKYQHKGTNADKISYRASCQKLLESKSEEDFDRQLLVEKPLWSQPFVKYFEKHLLEDMKHSCRYRLEILLTVKSITNNISESMNAAVKRFFEWKESSIDEIVLGLYYLLNYYVHEIQRGFRSTGEWCLKGENSSLKKKMTMHQVNMRC